MLSHVQGRVKQSRHVLLNEMSSPEVEAVSQDGAEEALKEEAQGG